MTKLKEIKARIAELQQEADATFKRDKQAAIADITSKMHAYNISITELLKREKEVHHHPKLHHPSSTGKVNMKFGEAEAQNQNG